MGKKPKPDFSQEDIINAIAELMAKPYEKEGFLLNELKELCNESGIPVSEKRLRKIMHRLKEDGRVISVQAPRLTVHGVPQNRHVFKFVGETERD